jgi:hypothetical protein
MFARILEFVPKMEKKEEFVTILKNEVVPILKKQTGFLEILPFFPETKMDKMINMSLWTERKYAERYEKEKFSKVEARLKPYLNTPITVRLYTLETTVCEHFEKVLVA